MLLGEALSLRADLKKRLNELKGRATSNARVQDGEQPGYVMENVLKEFGTLAADFRNVIQRINRTNSMTSFEGVTLADVLIERDHLTGLHAMYQNLAQASGETQHRHLRSEIKSVAQIRAADLQSQADKYSAARRELDVRIQAANWRTELVD